MIIIEKNGKHQIKLNFLNSPNDSIFSILSLIFTNFLNPFFIFSLLPVNTNSVMSRSQKSIPQPKKVAPPSVPDMYRYQNSPQSPSQLKDNDDGGFKRHLMEPLSPSCLTVSYQRRSGDPISHKAAIYYHQQYGLQEDQGIDLTQSPGRDSPGSSSGGIV